MSEETLRSMPFNKDAERAVLSVVLQWPDTIGQVLAHDTDSLFYYPAHTKIWNAIQSIHADRQEIEMIGLNAALRAADNLDDVGGPAAVAELMSDVPSPTLLKQYLKIVADDSKRRGIITDCWRVAQNAFDPAQKVESLIQELDNTTQRGFRAVTTKRARRFNLAISDAIDTIQRRMENPNGEIPGLSFGIPALDEATNGAQAGQMIVVAARPGRGKTSFAMGFGESLAKSDVPILIFSAEMLDEELAVRSLSANSNIDSLRLAKGKISKGELPALHRAIENTSKIPVWIDDRADMRLIDIQIETRRMVKEHGIKLVIVDYLGLIREPEGSRSREDAISKLSSGLKNLAKDLGIPIVVVAQLNRGPEKRTDKKPVASDLRDSGSIEQDAHIILLLHADDAQEGQMIIDMEIIVAKCRGGRLGIIEVEFHKPTTLFKPKSI